MNASLRSRRARRLVFRSITALATIALVAGCKVGPDPSRPDVPTPDSFRGATETQTAASPDELTWYALFEDPVPRELIREAIAGNDDLAIAASRVREARAA